MTKKEIAKVYSRKDSSCNCGACQHACLYYPGWFLPEEIARVAEYLRIPLLELFRTKLAVNWWEGDNKPTFVLAPVLKEHEPGTEYPADPRGECIFYEDERCDIHPVSPFECRKYLHGELKEEVHARHEAVALAWGESQRWIEYLLGRKAEARSLTMLDMLTSLF